MHIKQDNGAPEFFFEKYVIKEDVELSNLVKATDKFNENNNFNQDNRNNYKQEN